MLTCELSGKVVVHPVITPCHHVFEKDLIENYIASSGCCPICNSPLTTQDLYDIRITPLETYPATMRATSFDSLLSSLQNEWGAVQQQLFELRTKLATAQRELAQALYEKDAAKRVIARLLSENGLAIPAHITNPALNEGANQSNLASYFKKEAKIISRQNNSKKGQYAQDSRSVFSALIQFTLSRQGPILNSESTLSAIDNYPQKEILIGADNGIVLGIDPFNGTSNQYASFDNRIVSLISDASFTQFIAADRNGNVKICAISSTGSGVDNNKTSNLALNEITLSTQKLITSALFHPKGEHVIICYTEGIVEVLAINSTNPEHSSLDSILSFNAEMSITMAELHADGLYLFAANNESNNVSIFDVPNQKKLEEISMPNAITSIAAPRDNSIFIATGCNSCVYIWSLKTLEVIDEINIDCVSLSFDPTGFILSVIHNNGEKCSFFNLDESGKVIENHTIDLYGPSTIGRFSTNNNYFALIGDHDCIDFVSSQS